MGCIKRKRSRLPQDMEDSGDVMNKGSVLEQFDAVDPCRPVSDVSNTQDDGYIGSWVAEVSVVHRDAKAVKAYLDREGVGCALPSRAIDSDHFQFGMIDVVIQLRFKLRTARAMAKKYSVDTPLKSGPNIVRVMFGLCACVVHSTSCQVWCLAAQEAASTKKGGALRAKNGNSEGPFRRQRLALHRRLCGVQQRGERTPLRG
jgi:hypothetical protein